MLKLNWIELYIHVLKTWNKVDGYFLNIIFKNVISSKKPPPYLVKKH